MTREQLRGSLLLLLAVAASLLITTLALDAWMPDSDLEKSAQVIQGYAAAFTLLAGALFAAFRFDLFRNFIPHANISQQVSHRAISDSYVHILVTATLTNNSKVKMDFREGFCRLQLLGSHTDSEVEEIYRQVFAEDNPRARRDFQWTTLDEMPLSWDRNELIIEPGGSHQETCEFIVTAAVTSVLAYSYFYNPAAPVKPEGWGVTTAYDIMGSDGSVEVLNAVQE